MILSAALMHGLAMHLGAWMARDGEASDYVSLALYKEIARTAEAGKLHALFRAEQLTNREMGTERPLPLPGVPMRIGVRLPSSVVAVLSRRSVVAVVGAGSRHVANASTAGRNPAPRGVRA